MEKKSVNKGLVFLLTFLVVVGVFILYSELRFTGYVTNVGNATNGVVLSSLNFEDGDFSNTDVVDGDVVLDTYSNGTYKPSGTYTSQIFDASQNVFWTDFIPVSVTHSSNNYSEDSLNNSIYLYVRTCNNSLCDNEEFVLYSPDLSLVGQYFQYQAVMQILSGSESPVLSEVNVSYYPPMSLPINIESPQAITYYNESVPIQISSVNGSNIWFYYNGTNEVYSELINKVFNEGTHILNVIVSYIDGNVNYTNSTSVTFVVGFPKDFYRLQSNACSLINLTNAEKTVNDYATLAECQSHITSDTTTTTTETQTINTCSPQWVCDEWGECIDGMQTRICSDTSTCTIVSVEGKPPESQACVGGTTTSVAEETPVSAEEAPTTTEETKKGFFSFVGSAIVGPIFGSKVGIIFVILLVLAIGGFLAYKFFLKDKLKLKLFNFGKRKLFSFRQ